MVKTSKLAEKNLQIEALRGIGLLLIVIYHFFYRYQEIKQAGIS